MMGQQWSGVYQHIDRSQIQTRHRQVTFIQSGFKCAKERHLHDYSMGPKLTFYCHPKIPNVTLDLNAFQCLLCWWTGDKIPTLKCWSGSVVGQHLCRPHSTLSELLQNNGLKPDDDSESPHWRNLIFDGGLKTNVLMTQDKNCIEKCGVMLAVIADLVTMVHTWCYWPMTPWYHWPGYPIPTTQLRSALCGCDHWPALWCHQPCEIFFQILYWKWHK